MLHTQLAMTSHRSAQRAKQTELTLQYYLKLATVQLPTYQTACTKLTNGTSTDVIGSVITTGDARLEMFLPDTVALTTGELTVKP